MLGVRLTRNFNHPYLSQSYTDFFRHWHISLKRWFTQYVYIPLGGNRCGRIVKIRNMVIVFTLCGIWHGANWTYVRWGLYAAFFVCLESFLLPLLNQTAEQHGINPENPMIVFGRRLLMFFIFIPAALLFCAQSVEQIGEIITALASGTLSVAAGLEALRQVQRQISIHAPREGCDSKSAQNASCPLRQNLERSFDKRRFHLKGTPFLVKTVTDA